MPNEKTDILKDRVIDSIVKDYEDFQFSIQDVCRMHIVIAEFIYRKEVNPFGGLIPISTAFMSADNSSEAKTIDDIISEVFKKVIVRKKASSYEKQEGNVLMLTFQKESKPKVKYAYNTTEDDVRLPLRELEIDFGHQDSIEDIDDEEDK